MLRTLFAFILLSFCLSAVNAQSIYMKIDGVDGDAVDKGFEKYFTVQAFELVATNSGTTSGGPGGGAGKTSFGDAKLKKLLLSSANPGLMLKLSPGTHIKDVVFKWTKNTGKGLVTYYQIKLSDVLITSIGILSPECVGGGCNNLFEEMHLNYAKIEWTGYEQNKDGSPGTPITTAWDINTNKEP